MPFVMNFCYCTLEVHNCYARHEVAFLKRYLDLIMKIPEEELGESHLRVIFEQAWDTPSESSGGVSSSMEGRGSRGVEDSGNC